MIVRLEHVYKSYIEGKMETPVLFDINFSMEKGDYVAIMGPSGSGKSTVMNLIGCLDEVTQGTVWLDGEDITRASDKDLSVIRAKKIGFVFQNFQLLPYMTALENVALPLSYIGVPHSERKERAAKMLELVGLSDRMQHKPTQLSGGQKQRVAIARAMINEPLILLADEPTGALDSRSGEQVMEIFGKLNEQGVTVLMITHDPKVAAHAKRVVEIYDGRLSEPGAEKAAEPQEEAEPQDADESQEEAEPQDALSTEETEEDDE